MAKKVLIIEDEPDILSVTSFRLKKAGYEVLTVTDGQKALDFLKQNRPDLVLLDLVLPVVSGEEVCSYIKKDERLSNTPVILFTASVLDVDSKVKVYGADDFIMKPFEPQVLLEKIKRLIG
jgi:DNA-binding response OmpR family regulator